MSVPSISVVRMTGAAHREELPLLVLGPSLGTSAQTLWGQCAPHLTDAFDVLAWDLPGHGHNHAVPEEPFTMAELAQGVLHVVDDVLAQRGELGAAFAYAGVSIGGGVGQQLLLDHPDRVISAVMLCTGARIGDAALWQDRVDQVGASGTPVMVAGSAERWFSPGFVERHPEVASPLLHALQDAADAGYQHACRALADFDVRSRLGEIDAPVLAIAGADDKATPPAKLEEIAQGVRRGRLVVLDAVAHLAPAEAPETVARLVREHVLGKTSPDAENTTVRGPAYEAGMRVRREVLGADHVDRATSAATDLTREFQELITEYAWGRIWTRPGLDRRSRSMITLTAMIARGHHEELAMHLRAALDIGLTEAEIKEVILQSAIYCGVPDANTAFRIAQQVLEESAAQRGGEQDH
ncbi:MAG TPA: 4-carboxymuconolactone decarboxylase [Marmoricola sp.]|nr:4-carboxymuconolactone decarboxylase [Marmoricola sp.]